MHLDCPDNNFFTILPIQETDDLAKQLEDKANDLYTTVSENDIESPFSSSNCTQSTTELSESIEDQ